MKQYLLLTLALMLLPGSIALAQPITDGQGDVGIGTFAPHQSAIIDLSSVSKGTLLPRMTTSERDAIIQPAHALLIFNTSDTVFEYNVGDEFNPVWYRLIISDDNGRLLARLSPGSIWFGGSDSMATELRLGAPGQVLGVNSAGTGPEWVSLNTLNFWTVGGNTSPSSDILGTLDANSLDIRTDNVTRINIDGATGEVEIHSGLDLSGAGTALELNGDAGTAGQLMESGGPGTTPGWTSDPTVNSLRIEGSLSGSGPGRYSGSIPIPLGVWQMNIPYAGIQAGASVNVTVADSDPTIGIVPARVVSITPGVGFAVELSVIYDSPTGALQYIVVNP